MLIADWSQLQPLPGAPAGQAACIALGQLLCRLDEPVDLVVHSMAGPFGLRLLETHGERIRRLVLAAPGPPGNIAPTVTVLRRDDRSVTVQGVGGREITVPRGRLAPTEQHRDRFAGLRLAVHSRSGVRAGAGIGSFHGTIPPATAAGPSLKCLTCSWVSVSGRLGS